MTLETKKVMEYNDHFEEGFPMYQFRGLSEKEIVKMVDSCIKNNKDVYEMGYLKQNDTILY